MALHHMVLQQEIICSIYRVLKPGGVCIIREHDCSEDSRTFDGEIALAIDIQHSMYARYYQILWSGQHFVLTTTQSTGPGIPGHGCFFQLDFSAFKT